MMIIIITIIIIICNIISADLICPFRRAGARRRPPASWPRRRPRVASLVFMFVCRYLLLCLVCMLFVIVASLMFSCLNVLFMFYMLFLSLSVYRSFRRPRVAFSIRVGIGIGLGMNHPYTQSAP